MWPFNKIYYADDWALVDVTFVKHSEMGIGHTGWGIKLLLTNRKTGRPKKISIGNVFGMSSLFTIKDKLFSRHGIFMDMNKETIELPRKPNEDTNRM